MDLYEALDKVEEVADDLIQSMDEIKPDVCGLDARSGYRLYISSDAIAVAKGSRGALEYYGGFEYVQSDDRHEIGDYVFYTNDSDRVRGHIERWEESCEDYDEHQPDEAQEWHDFDPDC